MNDQIQQEIESKGLTAPRVTPADIEAEIVGEHYFTAAQGFEKAVQDESNLPLHLLGMPDREPPPELHLLTFCVLVLRNGFTVTGESACASPENFDAEVGKKVARQKAVEKVWPLLGFRLRDRLIEDQKSIG